MTLGVRCPSLTSPSVCQLARFWRSSCLGARMHDHTRATRCASTHGNGGSEQPPASNSAAAAGAAQPPPEPQFIVEKETVLHKRYLTLYNRAVRFPGSNGQQEGPTYEYDIIGHPQADFHFCVTFPYHSSDGTVTIIREFAQGLNQMMYCLPTGGFDPCKHTSYEACARAELSEEAHLAGGTWLPLIDESHPGIAEVKWCRNRFHSYLCLDPQPDAQPGVRDQEEFIEVCRVSVPELRQIMMSGDMLLPSVATCFIALERIQAQQQPQEQQARQKG